MSDKDDIDEKLERLTSATANVRPRSDFNARVLAAARAGRSPAIEGGFWAQLPRAARWVIPAAALAAALSIGFATADANAVDDAVVSTDDDGEVDW